MARVFHWAGEGLPSNAVIAPGQSGAGDLPLGDGMLIAGAMTIRRPESRPRIGFDEWVLFEDFVGARNRLVFKLDEPAFMESPVDVGDLPLEVYSLRFYFRMAADPPVWGPEPINIVSFCDGHENYSWSYQLSNGHLVTGGLTAIYKPIICTGYDGTPSWTTKDAYDDWEFPQPLPSQGTQNRYQCGTSWWRAEMQVDANRDPKVVVRLYKLDPTNHLDSTTPDQYVSLAGNPTSVAIDRVYFGDNRVAGYQEHTYMGRFELHDDYDLGGQFSSNPEPPTAASLAATGAPVTRKVWRFARYNGTETPPTPLAAGIWDGEDVNPIRGVSFRWRRDLYFTDWEGQGWFLPADMPDDTDTSIVWGDESNQWKKMSLYWPSGPVPLGGWPVILFIHGGFFIEGNFRQLRPEMVRQLTRAGFAVGSTAYRLSEVIPLGTSYPGYDGGAGEYPSHIVDIKNAMNFLASKGRSTGGDGTYPINTNKLILWGFSAGGYISLAAGATAGLTDDGYGRDLTADGNDGIFGVSLGPDRTPLGAISCGGPVDMTIAVANDPTVGYPPLTNGIMTAASKAFLGRTQQQTIPAGSLEATGLTNLIERQAAVDGPIAPMLYVRGTSDNLVVEAHVDALEAAMGTYAPDVPFTRMDANHVPHDLLERYLPFQRIIQWCKALL